MTNIVLLIVWLVITNQAADIYVASTGTNNTWCGSTTSPCLTVAYALGRGTAVKIANGKLTQESQTIAAGEKTVSIEGQSQTRPTSAPTDSDPCIEFGNSFPTDNDMLTVTSGSLTLKYFSIIINVEPTTNSGAEVLYVDNGGSIELESMYISGTLNKKCNWIIDVRMSGKLTISNTIICNFDCRDRYCIEVAVNACAQTNFWGECTKYEQRSAQSVTVSNSLFENIISSGTGSIFYLPSYLKVTPSIRGTTFRNCKSTSNNGGAIYSEYNALTLTGCSFSQCSASYGGAIYWGISTSSPSGRLTSLTFCNNEATGGSGHDVYISRGLSSSPLSDCHSYNNMKSSSFVYSNGNKDDWVTYHNDEDCPCDIDNSGRSCIDDIDDVTINEECASGGDPTSVSTTLYVSSTSTSTNAQCASTNSPCMTIYNALSKATTSGWTKVILMGEPGTIHQRDTSSLQIYKSSSSIFGTSYTDYKVWITAQNPGVIFTPSGTTIQYDVFSLRVGSLRLTSFTIHLSSDFSGNNALISATSTATVSMDQMIISSGKEGSTSIAYPLIECTFCYILYSFVILLF